MSHAKYLPDHWNVVEPLLRSRRIMLFLDFDGTLTPIAAQPDLVRLSDAMKGLIVRLAALPDLALAIVSGRSLEQLKRLVDVPDILYVGNHGYELEGPGLQRTHSGALETTGLMAHLDAELGAALKSVPGAFVENKTYTPSIHYRQVREEDVEVVRSLFQRVAQPFLSEAKILVTEGKKVLEIRPAVGWNKGAAVLWLWGRWSAGKSTQSILPIYVGDDRTDETALQAVKPWGMGIKIQEDNPLPTHADYYLRNPEEVYGFLEKVHGIKS